MDARRFRDAGASSPDARRDVAGRPRERVRAPQRGIRRSLPVVHSTLLAQLWQALVQQRRRVRPFLHVCIMVDQALAGGADVGILRLHIAKVAAPKPALGLEPGADFADRRAVILGRNRQSSCDPAPGGRSTAAQPGQTRAHQDRAHRQINRSPAPHCRPPIPSSSRPGNKVLCPRSTPSTKRFINPSRQSTGDS